MKIGLAQVNSWLGDFSGNREKILEKIKLAKEQQCDLVVFPEAALFGYHPCDLLERPSIVEAQMQELKKLEKSVPPGIAVVVGAIGPNPKQGKPFWNAAVWLEKGKKPRWFPKQLLPTYDVFDESRHIEPGQIKNNVVRWRGKNILITICEDIWAWPSKESPRYATYGHNPLKDVKKPIDLVVNLSASPVTVSKMKGRKRVTGLTAAHFKAPMVYVNLVGGQDELIFDGASFAIDAKGGLLGQCGRFQEDFLAIELKQKSKGQPTSKTDSIEATQQALVLGVRDFATKTGCRKMHLGLSGGIDSAVVACLAVDALGAKHVAGLAMPGPFSDPKSFTEARLLAENLGIDFETVPITEAYEQMIQLLNGSLGKMEFGVAEENIQARLRALVLMAYANRNNSFLLATSNKTELATGYSTLYGDMCGALMPIGDLLKRDVYRLAEFYNQDRERIPRFIIDRPPSAELRPNQKDQDSLPPYDVLDAIVEKLVEGSRSAKADLEADVLNRLFRNEFKRWQAPPILKVSDHAFGRGRRFPLAHRAKG